MHTKTTSPAARRYLLISAVLLFALLASSRLVSVFYSYAATDILYMTTALPTVLFWMRRVLTVIAFGAGVAAIVSAVFRFGARCGAGVFGIHAVVLFLDFLTAFLIDAISGAVSGGSAVAALLVGFSSFAWNALFSFIAWASASRCRKKGKTAERALTFGAVWYMAGRLFLELLYLLDFLIEVEFLPYPEEIAVIVGEFLGIIVLDGGAVWFSALLFAFLFRRIGRKNEKFTNNL